MPRSWPALLPLAAPSCSAATADLPARVAPVPFGACPGGQGEDHPSASPSGCTAGRPGDGLGTFPVCGTGERAVPLTIAGRAVTLRMRDASDAGRAGIDDKP